MTEYELHKAVVQHVRQRGMPGLYYFHPANSGRRTMPEIMRLRAMGFRSGVPDLFFLYGGTLFGLELKTLKGKATCKQLTNIDEIKLNGGEAEITYGLEHALASLKTWNLVK